MSDILQKLKEWRRRLADSTGPARDPETDRETLAQAIEEIEKLQKANKNAMTAKSTATIPVEELNASNDE